MGREEAELLAAAPEGSQPVERELELRSPPHTTATDADGEPTPLLAPAVDVALRDGATVHVRPLLADDEPALAPSSTGCRSSRAGFASSPPPPTSTRGPYLAALTAGRRVRPGRGHRRAGADRRPRGVRPRADPAARRGGLRGRRRLAGPRDRHDPARPPRRAGDRQGVETFTAIVLPENHRMIQVFRDSGFAVEVESSRASCPVELPAALGDEARARFEERDRIAAVAAVATSCGPSGRRDRRRRRRAARSARPCCATCASRLPGRALPS